MSKMALLAVRIPHVLCVVCLSHMAGSPTAILSPNETLASESEAFVGHGPYFENTACQEFRADSTNGPGWLLADCIDVWKSWVPTLGEEMLSKKDDREFFQDVSAKLRQQGTPCYVAPPFNADGAGSTSMRHLATTVYAQEMGCDYLFPGGYQAESKINGTMYCHAIEYKREKGQIKDENFRCAAVDWIEYFNFSYHMTALPDDGEEPTIINVRKWFTKLVSPNSRTTGLAPFILMEVQIDRQARNPLVIQTALDRFHKRGGFHHPPWVHWVLTPGNKASGYFITPSTWNAAKLQRVRDLLRGLRKRFRRNERPRYPDGLTCEFTPSRTNIAIHVRLGDRDRHQTTTSSSENMSSRHDKYYDMLEEFMDTVSKAVLRQGEPSPVFHIFSETSEPCPSTGTGAFEEFLRWPVETKQIEACRATLASDEYGVKTQGAAMPDPAKSGIFRVRGEHLHLHVGSDVENDMSCMIKADGILMGCSTFGQVAGVFSEGLKFFSVSCGGWMTGPHYKMVPPMAIAEQGDMWVPVSGSWRDPKIRAEGILDVTLSRWFAKLRRAR